MANHARAKLPWAVPEAVMELFAKEAMRAVFNGLYELDPEDYALGFKRAGATDPWRSDSTQVWSESSSHVEMRRGCQGLDQLAQSFEFEALAACFGAPVCYDEGIGNYKVDRPGRLSLLVFRPFCGGVDPVTDTRAKFGGLGKIAAALGLPGDSGEEGHSSMWGLLGPDLAKAKATLDPIFFSSPKLNYSSIYAPGPGYDAFKKAKEIDAVIWSARLNWAQAVDAAYPDGAGLDAKAAAAALLPSAALGVECPRSALRKASAVGLERALSVALMWRKPDSAREIHARLCEVSKDPAASEAKAKALCDKALARRSRVSEGQEEPQAAESAAALFESLELARAAGKIAQPRLDKKPGL